MKTKTGELSVKVTTLRLLTKSLRPMPDKFHGVADQEVKYRQRYVDLMIRRRRARRRFVARSKAVGRSATSWSSMASLRWRRPCCTPSRRRQRPPLRYTPQRAGAGDVPAHRPRAVL